MNRFALAALALACACSPALAAPPVEPVVAPVGAWLNLFLENVVAVVLAFVIPFLAKAIYGAIMKVAPWAALILTQERVEMSLNAAKDYGLNAARGAVKGKTLEIGEAIEVIKLGTEYAVANAPKRVIESEGGAAGIAERIFRKLDLPATANFGNVLAPALDALTRGMSASKAKGRR